MQISSFLATPHPTAFSFEILPPLRGKGIEHVFKSIERLMPFNPAYINITTHRTEVTYREIAEGMFHRDTVRKRPGTVAIAASIKGKFGIPTVPHVICSDYSRSELENELIDLSYLGITDLLVLRGDRARGENKFVPVSGGHTHAVELCRQINDFNNGIMVDGEKAGPLAVPMTYGVAGYPEKHDEAMNGEIDLMYLKEKVDAGAGYIVTQMFFDNAKYFRFVDDCRAAGIDVPVIPGIKPLTSLTQQTVLPKTFHIDLPGELAREFVRCKDNEQVKALGVEWAIQQARELKAANVPSIHFYSMNATASIEKIARAVY